MFGTADKHYPLTDDDYDDDPLIETLRILDYRYIRFSYHPLKDKFVLINSWKDPAWTDVRSVRAGIDGDEKEIREVVFGRNIIDIEQKTVPQLLMDEVWSTSRLLYAQPLNGSRPSTLSMSSKSPVLSYGPLTNTTTTPSAYS